jgi:hypothetical protein
MARLLLLLVLPLVFLHSTVNPVQSQQNEKTPSPLRRALKELRSKLKASLKKLPVGEDGLAGSLLDKTALLNSYDAVQADLTAACERIKVSPQDQKAGLAIRQSDWAAATSLLKAALKEAPDDAYAHYLTGICAIETGQYRSAAEHFSAVLKQEPESRLSMLLCDFSRRMAAEQSPNSPETIVTNYTAAEAVLQAKFKTESAGPLGEVFATPQLLKDPLFYKLICEAVDNRGPLSLDLVQLKEKATRSNDPYVLLAAASMLGSDEGDEVWQMLENPRHANEIDTIEVMLSCFPAEERDADDAADTCREQLAALRKTHADNGFWALLCIKPCGTDATPAEAALTDAELKLFEQAATAATFSLPQNRFTTARQRLLQDLGQPYLYQWQDAGPKWMNALPSIGNVLRRRIPGSIEHAGDRREFSRAHHLSQTALRIVDRIHSDMQAGQADLANLLCFGLRMRICEAAARALPHKQDYDWCQYQVDRLEAARRGVLSRKAFPGLVPLKVPVPSINRAFACLLDGQWDEWKLRFVRTRFGPDDRDRLQQVLTTEKPTQYRSFVYDRLLEAAMLPDNALMPLLRHWRDSTTEDDYLWVLIWASGESGEAEDIAWLRSRLNDDRDWVRTATAGVLNKPRK